MRGLVKRIQNRLGPTEQFLFNNGTKDALYSGIPKCLRPGAITIGAAEQQKVETAYREIGGFAGSLLAGMVVGVAVVSMATPVGWLGAVIISAGTAYGGKAIGETLGMAAFQEKGDVMNLKNGRILNDWCS